MDVTQLKRHLRCGANASGLILMLFFVLVYGGTWLISIPMQQMGDLSEGMLGDLYNFIAYSFQYIVTVPVLLLIFHFTCGKKTGQRLRDCLCKPKVPVKTMLRWILICLGITYAGAYVSRMFWMLLQSLTGLELVAQNFAADNTWLSMLTNLVAMIIYAPIFEEMLFRGTILRSMEKGGELPAALIGGILFGLWHTNFDQTIYTAVMGFCAAVLYLKTRTLFAPMLMHAFMNTIGAVQSLFMGSFNPYEMMELTTEEEMMNYILQNAGSVAVMMLSGLLVIGIMGVGIILLIIELVQYKQLFRFEKNENGMTTGQTIKACLTAPVMLIACIAMLVMTVLRAMGVL